MEDSGTIHGTKLKIPQYLHKICITSVTQSRHFVCYLHKATIKGTFRIQVESCENKLFVRILFILNKKKQQLHSITQLTITTFVVFFLCNKIGYIMNKRFMLRFWYNSFSFPSTNKNKNKPT